jgi:hypothetical protein
MHSALLLTVALLCTSWQALQASAQHLGNIEAGPNKSPAAVPQLLQLRTTGSAAAAYAGVPEAMADSSKVRWWEDSEDDDTKCQATYARSPRVVGLTSHATARACADSCRYAALSITAWVQSCSSTSACKSVLV